MNNRAKMVQTEVQNLPHIPDDILLNIVCGLPWKSVVRFKCLSLYWYSTIDNPTFIDLRAKNYKEITVRARNGVLQCFYSIDEYGRATEISPMIRVGSIRVPAVLSCDGLLCFFGVDENIQLFNPFSRETLTLPLPLPLLDDIYLDARLGLGFGFDPTMKKYKVIVCYRHRRENDANVLIFTVGHGNCVRKFANCDSGIPILDPVYVSGASHWLATERNGMITFNYVTEVFGAIAVPCKYNPNRFCLREFGERVCLVEERYDALWFWVLTDYENHEWVHHRVALPFSQHWFCWQNVLVIGDGKLLVNDVEDRCQYLCRYDENGEVFGMLMVTGLPSDVHNFIFETQTLSNFRLMRG